MSQKNYSSTTVNQYFAWLEKTVQPDTELYRAAHTYMEAQRAAFANPKEKSGPFLSVITRTQGKRPDMLIETLLCLAGQSNTDFELLIMGHNLNEEQHATVSEIIHQQPTWMQERTRFISVTGGTRTTPLNQGFEAAKGKYIAVLDDDDLVFDNWVEAFYELSQKHDGKILHSYSVLQDWETVGGDFPNTPCSAKAPSNIYCKDFHFMEELSANSCPLCTLAFPAYIFHEIGIRFDEELTTTEDWDYLMRCSFLTGVANTSKITFLYRNWLNAENSATVHKQDEWRANYKRIVERFVRTPIVMAPGTLHGIIDRHISKKDTPAALVSASELQLFYDDGTGFSAENILAQEPDFKDPCFDFCFLPVENEKGKNELDAPVHNLRFDPQYYGYLTVQDFRMRVIDTDGKEYDYNAHQAHGNGHLVNGRLIFLKNDPQIIIHFQKPIFIKQVLIECDLINMVEDDDITTVAKKEAVRPRKNSFIYRAARKCYRGAKKIGKKILRK